MFYPGVLALWTAFAALFGSTVLYVRSLTGHKGSQRAARQMYGLAAASTAVACGILSYLILAHDFRVAYVYGYSDLSLPLPYLVSSFWAGQEGSLLLWLLLGFLVGLPLIRYARHYEDRTLLAYNLTLIALLVILLKQSPFRFLEGLPPGHMPPDGQGLNPLLQNPWMTIHPPVMFLGYAAAAAPFAFAVAALWERRYEEWIKIALPWALLSVVTLGAGIILGGYWAYVTLGWGGYWAWDPVENASLVPWLGSIALVHGMLLQRSEGRFRRLNLTLALLTHVLVVYATFLTRSGVVADFSVHSFVDLGISGLLVASMLFFFVGGAVLLVWRWREIPTAMADSPLLSKTWATILAVSALLGTAVVVLAGTSLPLLTRLAPLPFHVGPDYYNRVTLPIGIGLALLLAFVPTLRWRGRHPSLNRRLALSGAVAGACTAIAAAAGARGWVFLIFLFASMLAFAASAMKIWECTRLRRWRPLGGHIAHMGFALMLAGIITSSAWGRDERIVLPLNEPHQALNYTLTFRGVERQGRGGRDAMLVEVEPARGRSFQARPRMFRSAKTNQIVAHPHVRARLTHDLYLSPVEFDPGVAADAGLVLDMHRGEVRRVSSYMLRFTGFELPDSHGNQERVTIGAVLEVTGPDGTTSIVPALASRAEGFEAVPVPFPGSARGELSLVAVNASTGLIRLHINGINAAPAARASLAVGEVLEYRGNWIKLVELTGEPHGVRAILSVTPRDHDAQPALVSAAMFEGEDGGHRHEDGFLPGLGPAAVRIEQGEPRSAQATVSVLDPDTTPEAGRAMRFAVDVSVKPMISLLWAGSVLLLAGGVLALVRRGEEFAAAEECAGGPEAASPQPARPPEFPEPPPTV